MNKVQDTIESDTLPGTKNPRLAEKLIGHTEAWNAFEKSYESKNIHHAWIISGRKGIGKATFAWKMAKKLIEQDKENKTAKTIYRQIKALSVPNLFLCRRPYDEKSHRLKKFITVDEIRKLKSFFYMSATENAWRVTIIDCADELNGPASNALLKILEEPPYKSIFLIIANQPRRLKATIRSRCRFLTLKKLPIKEIEEILEVAHYDVKNMPARDRDILSVIAEGSAGLAIEAIENDGISIFKNCIEILLNFPHLDRTKINQVAETVKGKSDKFKYFSNILLIIISRIALLITSDKIVVPTEEEKLLLSKIHKNALVAHNLANLHLSLSKSFLSSLELNLDTSNQVVNAFINIEETILGSLNE